MSKSVIIVDGIGKQYKIGLRERSDKTFREAILDTVASPFSRFTALREKSAGDDLFWALKDVSFQVEPGEVVGIIGRNGAGKSTLLKILSRITEPTTGQATIRGQVGSLLEVGTGFHRELTGRENIYLNGAILGMKKADIDRKFDDIVAFADVEQFLETPVKRFSSGMAVRLAFSVAAYLEPHILLVDEVLAVGDAQFQKKCLRAMGQMHGGGRTVLFVSHNMAAIENLCPRAIWIDQGRIRVDGNAREVIKAYLATSAGNEQTSYDLTPIQTRDGTGDIRFTRIEFLDLDRQPKALVSSGDSLVIRLHYSSSRRIQNPHFGIEVYTDLGTRVTTVDTWPAGFDTPFLPPGDGRIDVEINFLNLRPGRYYLSLWLGTVRAKYDYLDHCAVLDVETSDFYKSGRGIDGRYGIIFLDYKWKLQDLQNGREAC